MVGFALVARLALVPAIKVEDDVRNLFDSGLAVRVYWVPFVI